MIFLFTFKVLIKKSSDMPVVPCGLYHQTDRLETILSVGNIKEHVTKLNARCDERFIRLNGYFKIKLWYSASSSSEEDEEENEEEGERDEYELVYMKLVFKKGSHEVLNDLGDFSVDLHTETGLSGFDPETIIQKIHTFTNASLCDRSGEPNKKGRFIHICDSCGKHFIPFGEKCATCHAESCELNEKCFICQDEADTVKRVWYNTDCCSQPIHLCCMNELKKNISNIPPCPFCRAKHVFFTLL